MKAIDRENQKLRIAHGESGGFANYSWQWCENLYFPFIVPGKWDYSADPNSGIIAAVPVTEMRKIVPWLHSQWVLCRYMAPPPETTWKQQFGTKVAWPRNGYYAPTNVELSRGISPWDVGPGGSSSITDMVIAIAREERQKTIADLNAEGERAIEYREQRADSELEDKISELLPAFPSIDHIPGKRGSGISFGGIE